MAIKYQFDGRDVVEPGSYSRIVSGIPQRTAPTSSGKVLIIDTGIGAGWGSGAGVMGQNSQKNGSIYEFSNATSFQHFLGGGIYYDLAPLLFNPTRNEQGVEGVVFVRASTTTAPTVTLSLAGASAVVWQLRNEGLAGNAVIRNGKLIKGYAATLKVSPRNATKFVLQVFRGGFRGVDNSDNQYQTYSPTETYNSGDVVEKEGLVFRCKLAATTGLNPINDVAEAKWALLVNGVNYLNNVISPLDCTPELQYTTREFTKVSELVGYMNSDATAKRLFVPSNPVIGTDTVTAGDLATNVGYVGATGGVETYTQLQTALDYLAEEDYSFVLLTEGGYQAKSPNNEKIFDHVINESEYKRNILIPGASLDDDLVDASIDAAQYYDSEFVTVVHGNCILPNGKGGTRTASALYLTAMVLGRIAGLPPQVPGTWKDLGILGSDSQLSKPSRELALQSGVLHLRKVGSEFVINQAINTLQLNSQLVNGDASTYEISIARIKQQLIKELVSESLSVKDSQGNRVFVGGNKGTATAEDVKVFTEGYLMRRTATPSTDNLILSFKNVVITELEDAWATTFGFTANGPQNKLFTTGTMLQSASIQ